MTGKHAPLAIPGEFPCCAMMQVAAEDTHDDYVVCRGYDPRHKRFFDYVQGDADKAGIAVGKPYGSRRLGAYVVGQIFPAFIPLTRIGQTPGVAAVSAGHPAGLDEVVNILYDENARPINWLLLDTSQQENPAIGFEMKGIRQSGTDYQYVEPGNFASYKVEEITGGSEESAGVTVLNAVNYGDPFVQLNSSGAYRISVNVDYGQVQLVAPTYNAFPVEPSNFGRIYSYLTLYYRNVDDAAWVYCDSSYISVYFFQEGYDENSTLTSVWDFAGNEDGETELKLDWAAYYRYASAGKIQLARMRAAIQRVGGVGG